MGMVGLSTRYLVVDGGEPILTPLYWRIRSGAWNLISLGLRYQTERSALGLAFDLGQALSYESRLSLSNSQSAGPVATPPFLANACSKTEDVSPLKAVLPSMCADLLCHLRTC